MQPRSLAPATSAPAALSRSLSPRHVTMISMGGMIGAGVFVGSSAAIAGVGPAIVLSYLIAGVLILLVMRMLAEMATALPNVRSFTEEPIEPAHRTTSPLVRASMTSPPRMKRTPAARPFNPRPSIRRCARP